MGTDIDDERTGPPAPARPGAPRAAGPPTTGARRVAQAGGADTASSPTSSVGEIPGTTQTATAVPTG